MRGRGGQAGAWGDMGAEASPGRYQGLEQRLEAELRAAATSKEEALMELKSRALQLEEELFQVRLSLGAVPALPPSHQQTSRAVCAPGPPAPPLVMSLDSWPVARLVPPLGACWKEHCAESHADSAQTVWSSWGRLPHSLNGQNPVALLWVTAVSLLRRPHHFLVSSVTVVGSW